MTTGPAARRHDDGATGVTRHPWVAPGGTVVVLAAITVTDHLLAPPWWIRTAEAGALLLGARLSGLGWEELGLSRAAVPSGLRWALGAIAVVAPVYTVGVLLPATRPAFRDARYDLPPLDVLRSAFLVIPAGTVLLEETAFRSVLWGVLERNCSPRHVLAATSVGFGWWHVLSARHLAATNQAVAGAVGGRSRMSVTAATVAATTVGGLVFGELRRRSGSVLAGAGAHWATNSLGVLFGLVARHLASAAQAPRRALG